MGGTFEAEEVGSDVTCVDGLGVFGDVHYGFNYNSKR
jgi:hypothetical protein